MARYVNIYREKNIVIGKAYDGDYGDWIREDEFVVVIEKNDGCLIALSAMDEDYWQGCTADDYLKQAKDSDERIIMKYDCAMRDELIKDNITEWVCNEGCVSGSSLTEAISHVVSLLTRHDMWKDEYAKCIDVERIKNEWDE